MNEQTDDFLSFIDEIHEWHVKRIEAYRKLLAEGQRVVVETVETEFDWGKSE